MNPFEGDLHYGAAVGDVEISCVKLEGFGNPGDVEKWTNP